MKTKLEKEFARLSKGTKDQKALDEAYQKALAATKKPYTPSTEKGKKYARALDRITGLAPVERESKLRQFEVARKTNKSSSYVNALGHTPGPPIGTIVTFPTDTGSIRGTVRSAPYTAKSNTSFARKGQKVVDVKPTAEMDLRFSSGFKSQKSAGTVAVSLELIGSKPKASKTKKGTYGVSVKKPIGYVVATDSFMSGWGGAKGGRSLYAIAVTSRDEIDVVMDNMKARSEMKRVRYNLSPPATRPGDHLKISDKSTAPRFFLPPHEGGFATPDDNTLFSHPPKFKVGQTVSQDGRKGVVTYVGPYDETIPDRTYKVRFEHGNSNYDQSVLGRMLGDRL